MTNTESCLVKLCPSGFFVCVCVCRGWFSSTGSEVSVGSSTSSVDLGGADSAVERWSVFGPRPAVQKSTSDLGSDATALGKRHRLIQGLSTLIGHLRSRFAGRQTETGKRSPVSEPEACSGPDRIRVNGWARELRTDGKHRTAVWVSSLVNREVRSDQFEFGPSMFLHLGRLGPETLCLFSRWLQVSKLKLDTSSNGLVDRLL